MQVSLIHFILYLKNAVVCMIFIVIRSSNLFANFFEALPSSLVMMVMIALFGFHVFISFFAGCTYCFFLDSSFYSWSGGDCRIHNMANFLSFSYHVNVVVYTGLGDQFEKWFSGSDPGILKSSILKCRINT